MKPKVFGIGFHKTGTKSLARALGQLGYRVCGPVGVRDPHIAQRAWELAFDCVRKFDAFQDNPFPILFKRLDAFVPGSKFILTLRDEERWIRSVCNYFGQEDTPMRTWIYGTGHPVGHEQTYLQRFNAHNQQVLSYFEGRGDDLLVMDITAGDGWEKLCAFLKQPPPTGPFPHANRAKPSSP